MNNPVRVAPSYQNKSIYILFIFFIFFLLELFISYQQTFNKYSSDLLPHLNAIQLIGKQNFPQMGFEYATFILAKVTQLSYQWTAILLLSFSVGLEACLIFFFINKLAKISGKKCVVFTIITIVCSAIYLPWFSYAYPLDRLQYHLSNYFLQHPYHYVVKEIMIFWANFFSHYGIYGIGSPNIWHSPTLIIVKPLALIITYLYVTWVSSKKDIFISCLLLVTCFLKPSFAVIFLPAVITREFIRIPENRSWLDPIMRMVLIILPCIVVLGCMYYVLTFIFKTSDGQHSYIIFNPFGVIHLYVKNAFITLLQGIAFPLAVLLIRFKEVISNNEYLSFSWLMFIFAYLYWALLSQSGVLGAAGNFGWSYNLGLSFIFIFSIIEYIKYRKLIKIAQGKSFFLKILTILLSLHFLSGGCNLMKVLANFLVI